MRAKLHLRWKLRSKTRKEEIQLDQRQQRLNGTGKKRWWHCLFYHWGASARSCLEIWLALLSGPSCKLNVLSNASTLCFTDIMKPPLKVEPGRDEQRFPACQKSDWKSGHPPACQIGNPRPILTTKISRRYGWFWGRIFKVFLVVVMCCLMSSDVSWHVRDKLWPMPKHGSIILYIHAETLHYASCSISDPRKPEGSLGRTAQDVHLDSHTAPELWGAIGDELMLNVLRCHLTY